MNTKAWIGFFGGAIAASVGSYLVLQNHSAPAPVAVVAPEVTVTDPAPVPHEAHAKRTVKKKAAAVTAAIDPDPGPASQLQTASQPQAAPQPAPQPVEQELAASAPPPHAPDPPPPPPVERAPEPPHSVTIAEGTLISVRLNDKLTTQKNQTGDVFSATLDQPLVADGFVIAERGARVEGRVVQAEQAGRVKGVALLSLELNRMSTADGQKVEIHTASFEKKGPENKKEDAAKIGAGAVLGTIIGAVAGGGKGAGIGAGAGGAAGAGTVMATRGKPAELPVETRISFKLEQPVTITEQRR
jgi:hypothetical protein